MLKDLVQNNPLLLLLLAASPSDEKKPTKGIKSEPTDSYLSFVYRFVSAQCDGKDLEKEDTKNLNQLLNQFYPFSPEIRMGLIQHSAAVIKEQTKKSSNAKSVKKKLLGAIIGLSEGFNNTESTYIKAIPAALGVKAPWFLGKSFSNFTKKWLNPRKVPLKLDTGSFVVRQSDETFERIKPLQDLKALLELINNQPDTLVIETATHLKENNQPVIEDFFDAEEVLVTKLLATDDEVPVAGLLDASKKLLNHQAPQPDIPLPSTPAIETSEAKTPAMAPSLAEETNEDKAPMMIPSLAEEANYEIKGFTPPPEKPTENDVSVDLPIDNTTPSNKLIWFIIIVCLSAFGYKIWESNYQLKPKTESRNIIKQIQPTIKQNQLKQKDKKLEQQYKGSWVNPG